LGSTSRWIFLFKQGVPLPGGVLRVGVLLYYTISRGKRKVDFFINAKYNNNIKTKLMTERVNHEKGYRGIIICTAKEVLEDDQYSKEQPC